MHTCNLPSSEVDMVVRCWSRGASYQSSRMPERNGLWRKLNRSWETQWLDRVFFSSLRYIHLWGLVHRVNNAINSFIVKYCSEA